MPDRVYLDYNATTPLRAAAREAMLRALDLPGNASSVHAEGRSARAEIETARRSIAALVGADPRGVIFTASATEAANLVLTPSFCAAGRGSLRHLLVGATEHVCVLSGHRFEAAKTIPVGRDGILDRDALAGRLRDEGSAMVAVQAANNETGVTQPLADIAAVARAAGAVMVCDAVQAVGRMPLTLRSTGADALILSSHKLGGPKGAGALILADPDAFVGQPLVRGGGQERGARAGTEDVAAIAGFGAAAAAVLANGPGEAQAALTLRDAIETGLRAIEPGVVLICADAPRLPNTTCFAVPGVKAATLLMALDLAGIAVSAGSACSSGKIARSHVLDAMGLAPHIADSALRVSVGWQSDDDDVARFLAALRRALATIRRSGRAV